MSSSNQVRITLIEETTYGETPVAGNFETARFTSDSLSGTPETTESQQIRTDRLSSGQVVTGLTVGGDISYELAKEDSLDFLLESAMFNSWAASSSVSVDLTIAATAKTLTRASGDWNSDIEVGDLLILGSFSNSVNNTQVMVASIDSNTQITYIGPETIVDEVGSGTTYQIADELTVGTTKKSFSMEKAFLDLTNRAIIYKGMIASNFSLSAAYGSIVTGSFSFSGNYHDDVSAAVDFITNGRTINAAATTNLMNGSVDMPFIASSATGIFADAGFCIQGVDISLNNNLTPRTCVGSVPPQNYSEGTAQIEVSISAYLSDSNWSILAKKISQESFGVGFQLKNSDGYYAFYIPAVQVSFDDPAAAGINQDVILTMSGVAKVGANGESSLKIFRS